MRAVDVGLRSLVGLVLCLTFAVGLVACGDSESDGDANAETSQSESADEKQIESLVADLEKAFAARDVKTICAASTPQVRKQLASLENYKTCEKGLYDYLTDDPTGEPVILARDVVVDGVKVSGRQATVTAGKAGEAAFVKQNGKWWLVTWFVAE